MRGLPKGGLEALSAGAAPRIVVRVSPEDALGPSKLAVS